MGPQIRAGLLPYGYGIEEAALSLALPRAAGGHAAVSAPKKSRRTQAERRAETRGAVLESACRLFGSKGYAETSLEEIAAACGMTIRPIYHYFGNKRELFAAVNEVMEERIIASMQTQPAAVAAGDPRLVAWRAFLDLCQDPEFRRIVLIDSPNVLGRERWAASAVTRFAQGLLRGPLGGTGPETPELAVRMLIGAFAEAALSIAESDDPEQASREADVLVTRLVEALFPGRD
ncbi:MAG: TetR/AcrR family transcriptional regulator [Deltaproteobacteria bacterium]|nr:TetR/AcrR family transcriptional regulator [Deltaproteobacteria bacterium]